MTERSPSRRRLLVMLGATGAAALATGASGQEGLEWSGTALGAEARIILLGMRRRAAEEAIRASLQEIDRLERIFSLHRQDAELVQLNEAGRLRGPSLELTWLLRQCEALHGLTEGLFDPTVQPLWRAYARWHRGGLQAAPLPPDRLADLLARVGMHRVHLEEGAIRLEPGTAITLNGIAQGFITDRVAQVLRQQGLAHVLLDLGEVRALDGRPEGRPFDIVVRESGLRLALAEAALATSAPGALMLSRAGSIGHILHPLTGRTPGPWHSVTVRHPSAAIADGLSTALALADPDGIRRIAGRIPGVQVWAARPGGPAERLG